MTEEKTPVFVHCADCNHEWPGFYTPLTLDAKGMNLLKQVGKMPCPKCASKKVFMGPAKAVEEIRMIRIPFKYLLRFIAYMAVTIGAIDGLAWLCVRKGWSPAVSALLAVALFLLFMWWEFRRAHVED